MLEANLCEIYVIYCAVLETMSCPILKPKIDDIFGLLPYPSKTIDENKMKKCASAPILILNLGFAPYTEYRNQFLVAQMS